MKFVLGKRWLFLCFALGLAAACDSHDVIGGEDSSAPGTDAGGDASQLDATSALDASADHDAGHDPDSGMDAGLDVIMDASTADGRVDVADGATDGSLAVDGGTLDAGPCAIGQRLCLGICRVCPMTAHISDTACTGGTCIASACEPGFVLGDNACFSEASPDVAKLYEPARFSAEHECSGTVLSANEIVALFDRGFGRLSFRSSPTFLEGDLGSIARFRYTRTCNVSGCSPVTSERLWTDDLHAQLEVAASGTLTYVAYGASGSRSLPNAIDDGDFLVTDRFIGNATGVSRARIVRETDGAICFSTVARQFSSTTETYYVTRTRVRVPVLGSSPDDAPPFTSESVCSGGAETNATIIAGWFAPGGTSVSFASVSTLEQQGFSRYCHPQTQCSAWRSAIPRYALHAFELDGADALEVRLHEYGTSSGLAYPMVGGAYAGTRDFMVGAWSVTHSFHGHATSTCIDQVLSRDDIPWIDAGPDSISQAAAQLRYSQ